MDDQDFDKIAGPFLGAARRSDAQVPDGLTGRVLADAHRQQDRWRRSGRSGVPSPTLWMQFLGAIGGLPALGGLAAACAAGIWLGISPPGGLDPADLVGENMAEFAVWDLQDTLLTDGLLSEGDL